MDPPSSSAPIRQIARKPINSPNLHNVAPQSTPQPPPANHSPVLDQSDQSEKDAEVQKPLPAFVAADLDSKKESPAPSVETGSITPITYALYAAPKPTLRQRFDILLPPGKTYWKRFTRRAFLFILLGIMLLAVLIIALALGLGLKSRRGVANLPLPGNAAVHKGELTYYDVGLGACGIEHGNGDVVCAVSHLVYDAMVCSLTFNECMEERLMRGRRRAVIQMRTRFVERRLGLGGRMRGMDIGSLLMLRWWIGVRDVKPRISI